MSFYGWRPYVPVGARRAQGMKKAAALVKSGRALDPVVIEGRTIASTFWGKAWCNHMESFSDFSNRLPRGRSYARNGSVLDLQIRPGKVSALVMGSSLYKIEFSIDPLPPKKWKAIKGKCAGQIDSLVELLRGKFSDGVMRIITDSADGIFPKPAEINKSCSCPDWADLCKHLAAVLYGIGARLDSRPELLFLLRDVDHTELLESVGTGTAKTTKGGMDEADLADVFGIEIEAAPAPKKKPAAKGKKNPAAEKAKPKKRQSPTKTRR